MSETGGFTARSQVKVILFSIVTLGLYAIYWLHQFHVEAKAEVGADYNPTLRTIGLFVPFYNFLVVWKDCKIIESEFDMSAGIAFLLWAFTGPIWMWILQGKINEHVRG
jgi:hypothetical protein